jgi:hypothetical protein
MSSTGATATGPRRGDVTRNDAGRAPALLFCRIVGPTLLLVGLIGFIVDSTFDTPPDNIGGSQLLGLFEVNGWHNIVHILSGLLLLAFAKNWRTARTGALIFGLTYGLVTVWGLVDGDDVFGIIPVNGEDNVLHVVLSVAALGAALATRPREDRTRV